MPFFLEDLLMLTDPAELLPYLTRLRRAIHRRPEEGWCEFETTRRVTEALEADGFDVRVGTEVVDPEAAMGRDPVKVAAAIDRARAAGVPEAFLERLGGWTGAAAEFDTGRPGPVTLLRFEIDCVVVSESQACGHRPVDDGFVSTCPGLMHACAHDVHAATGLAIARWVKLNRDRLCGRIRFVFQPAEEGVRGARAMIAKGLAHGVDYCWTQHMTTSIRQNEVFASRDGFLATAKIDVGFEGTSPYGTALTAATDAALRMQALPRSSDGASRISVGVIDATSERARMAVEVRGAVQSVSDFMEEGVRRAVRSAAEMAGVTSDIRLAGRAEALLPCAKAADMIERVAATLPGITVTEDRTRGSDDSTLWMNAVVRAGGTAGCFHYGCDSATGLHTSTFDPQGEDAAIPALRLTAGLIADVHRR